MINKKKNNPLQQVCTKLLILSISLVHPNTEAVENPVDTLPKADVPKTRPNAKVEVEQQSGISAEMQKVLDTEVQPSSFGIYGVKAVPFEEVSAIFAPYANKKVTIARIIELSREVTQYYQSRGLALSFCYIPTQNFNDPIIKVIVIEGHVSSVKFEGNPGATEAKLREIVAPILAEKPLTRATMERYSTMLGLLPGLKIQASLPLPQQLDGASELLLKVERKSIDGVGRIESLQPFSRGIITLKANGNTHLAEEITVSTLISGENERYFAASYAQPLGREGLVVRVDASDYDGKPTADLEPGLGRHVTSQRANVALSYPLVLRQDRSLLATASFTATKFEDQIRSKASGRALTSNTEVRAVSVGGIYSDSTPTRARRLQLTMSRGLDALGAKNDATTNFGALVQPAAVDLNFSKFVLNYVQRNYFPNHWGSSISTTLQYSDDDLPITEKVLFGGYQHGRAYRPGQLVGDSGWGIGFELNRTIPFSYQLPYYQVAAIQPYFLFEAARAYQHTQAQEFEHLRSITLGIRLISNQPDRTNLDFSLSKAVAAGGRNNVFKDLAFGFNFGIPF